MKKNKLKKWLCVTLIILVVAVLILIFFWRVFEVQDTKLVKRNLCGYNISFRDTYINNINITEKLVRAINNEQVSDYSSQYCKYFHKNFTFTDKNDFLILNIRQDDNFYNGSYYVNFYQNNRYLSMPDFLIDLNDHKIYNINTEDGERTNILGEL